MRLLTAAVTRHRTHQTHHGASSPSESWMTSSPQESGFLNNKGTGVWSVKLLLRWNSVGLTCARWCTRVPDCTRVHSSSTTASLTHTPPGPPGSFKSGSLFGITFSWRDCSQHLCKCVLMCIHLMTSSHKATNAECIPETTIRIPTGQQRKSSRVGIYRCDGGIRRQGKRDCSPLAVRFVQYHTIFVHTTILRWYYRQRRLLSVRSTWIYYVSSRWFQLRHDYCRR